MHAFCLTIPWGALLLIGGLVGGISKGSLASLVVGAGIGAALLAIGWTSMQEYNENKNSDEKKYRSPTYAYEVVAAILTLIVGITMYDRWQESENMMPAGYVTIASGLMILFYVYKLGFSGDVGSHAERAYKRND